ncbi:MAG: flagellar biosynthetic protein [Sphingomonadales bacterium]
MSEAVITRISLVDARAPASAFSPMRVQASGSRFVRESVGETVDDVFAQGYAEGERAVRASFNVEREALATLLAAADALQPESSEELAAMIAMTVERLVAEIVGQVDIDRTWMLSRIERAVGHIGEADAARTLWLHPDDLALLDGIDFPIELRPDPDLERGALRIDCSSGWIEDSRSLHLEALRATLGTGAVQ